MVEITITSLRFLNLYDIITANRRCRYAEGKGSGYTEQVEGQTGIL